MDRYRFKEVFSELLPTVSKRAPWEIFIMSAETSDKEEQRLLKAYEALIKKDDFYETLGILSDIEIAIIQKRYMASPKITLSLVPQKRADTVVEYVVARSPFYIKGKERQEIRVYLGRVDDLGRGIKALERDKKFMDKATIRVVHEMNKHFQETLNLIKNVL
jgi:hypothetical protein